MSVDFGRTTQDYAKHRAGFPEAFSETTFQKIRYRFHIGSLSWSAKKFRRRMMTLSSEELIRNMYEARERGDLETVRGMLAEDVAWIEPDLDNPHTGDLRGADTVVGMIREAQRITGGTFRLAPRQIVSHGEQVVAFIDWSAERDGGRIDGKEIAVYRVQSGKITEAFFHVDNPGDDQEFWK